MKYQATSRVSGRRSKVRHKPAPVLPLPAAASVQWLPQWWFSPGLIAAALVLCVGLTALYFVRASPRLSSAGLLDRSEVILPHPLAQPPAPAPAGALLPPPPSSAAAPQLPPLALPLPGSPAVPPLTPDDLVFAGQLARLLEQDGDPWDRARGAWESGRVWPITFMRSATLFAPRPPATLEESLAPAALAALTASKTHDVSIIMPGNAESAIFKYNQEAEYYAEYAASWKAWTWAKGGVDCNRHLEIVCSGVIPLFRGVRSIASPTTLFSYPRALMAYYEERAPTEQDPRRLAMMRHHMLHWAHRHLAAPRVVDYMARAADHTAAALGLPPRFTPANHPPLRLAFIDSSLPQAPDYLSNFVLLGLVERYGPDAVDVLHPPLYMYPGGPDKDGRGYVLYGNGFGMRHRLQRPSVQPSAEQVLQRLRAGEYDAVVWGSYTRSADHHLEEAVVKAYAGQPHRLWLCDGADSYSGWPVGGAGPWAALRLNATVFVREHVNIPL